MSNKIIRGQIKIPDPVTNINSGEDLDLFTSESGKMYVKVEDTVKQVTLSDDLDAHAEHDRAMYEEMTQNIKTGMTANLDNYYTKEDTNTQILSAISNFLTTDQITNMIASQVSQNLLSADQINSIVNAAISAAGQNMATKDYVDSAVLSDSGALVSSTETDDDPNGQYKLYAYRYANGLQIISGWVEKCGDRFSAYFPTGFEFINTNYSAFGCVADDEANLDNNDVNSIKFGSLRTNSFTCICSKFGLAVLAGAAIDDQSRYSVGFVGRWK